MKNTITDESAHLQQNIEQFIYKAYSCPNSDYSTLFIRYLIDFSIVSQELQINMTIRKDMIKKLIDNKIYYFNHSNSIFYGYPLLSLILLFNKNIFSLEEYTLYQENVLKNITSDYKNIKSFEYIKGIAGFINYLLIFKREEPVLFNRYFQNVFINSLNNLTHYIAEEEFMKFPINISLAHGLAGIMLVLSLCYNETGFKYLNDSIEIILTYLLNLEKKYKTMPSIIDVRNTYARIYPSWCYTQLGIYHSIIVCANSLKKESIKNSYLNKIRLIINQIENYNIITTNFCHGYSGILVFNKLYNNNDINIINHCLSFIHKENRKTLIDSFFDYYYDPNKNIKQEINFSFLDGVLSVFSSLLYINDLHNQLWEKLVLI